MKFSITRSALLEGLQTVQNVVAVRSTLHILTHALFQAEDGCIRLTATDLDISVRCPVEAAIEESGSTTLPVRRLLSIVRELPDGRINISVNEDDQAELECCASFFRVLGLAASEFPSVPSSEDGFSYALDQGAFREMLRKTSYAASTDETRQVLNGVLMAFKEGKLTMVATDGRRLALVEHEVEFPPESEAELILPSKAVHELLHILGDDGKLRVVVLDKQILFMAGNIVMSSKRIDGVYPNYRQVIPPGCQERIVIERETLLNALKRVSLMNTEKSNATRFTFGNNQLVIITNTPDIGEARETIPIKYDGTEITVIFNPEYVMDPLRNLDCDEVFFEMNDGHSPALLKCNIPFLYVLMPLRIAT